jgi:acylphosphatase
MMRQHVVVQGMVQGVGYRYSCEQKARELGIKGWVWNRHDGGVEAVFEGEDDAVTQMVEWARRGPRHARVTEFEVRDEEPRGDKRFDIKF